MWLVLALAFVGTYTFANRVLYGTCIMAVSMKLVYDVFLLIRTWLIVFILDLNMVLDSLGKVSLRHFRRSLVSMAGWLSDPNLFHIFIIAGILILLAVLFLLVERGNPKFKRFSKSYEPDFVPERMVPGSQFQLNAEMPRFQVEIYGTVDGVQFYPAGQGFWVEDSILTAAHVIYDFDQVKLVRDGVEVLVDAEHFKTLDGDLARLPIQPGFVGKLKMSKAKLARVGATKNGGLMAQVVAFGQRSFGFVNPYEQFGYCSYGGSTIKGFSGAPYFLNNTVFGMHLGGNLDNLGYEGSYIRSLLKPTTVITTFREDSEEWLIDQVGRETEVLYERSPFDVDEYKVKVGGSYHIVDSEVLGKLLGKVKGKKKSSNFTFEQEALPRPTPAPRRESISRPTPRDDSIELEDLPLCPRDALSYKDQGNLIRAPASAGALGQEQDLKNVLREEMRTLREMVLESRKPLEKSHMESRQSTHAPQNGASQSTVARRNRRRKSNAQRLSSLERQLFKPLSHTDGGQPRFRNEPLPSGSKSSSTAPLLN